MITSVGYNREAKILEVEFPRGAVYHYFDVPVSVFEGIMNASVVGSVGVYFTQNVKTNYEYKRIN